MKKLAILILLIATILPLTACYAMYTIPSGHVGKVLTPSGWADGILEPGQINLGTNSASGQLSRLVLLEASTVTILETFRDKAASTDGQDHRILTKDGVPLSVDMYVRVMLPDDLRTRDSIFLQVTPDSTDDKRVTIITLKNIYARFAEMDVRNRVRNIVSQYENFQDVLNNYPKVGKDIAAAAILAFRDSYTPLRLQDAQLSQILPDPQVWDSEVKKKAADAQGYTIEKIGQAMEKNPGYQEFLKWQSLQNIAAEAAKNGNNTIVITDSGSANGELWAATQSLQVKRVTPTPIPTATPEISKNK